MTGNKCIKIVEFHYYNILNHYYSFQLYNAKFQAIIRTKKAGTVLFLQQLRFKLQRFKFFHCITRYSLVY